MSKQYKIGLIGTPGSGRTSVAVQLSEQLQIPFLSSRAITQKILDRDGYNYISGIYVEKFLADKNREIELIDNKIKIEKNTNEFVTDRTTLEQFAYAMLYLEQYTDDEMYKLMLKCKNHLQIYSHLIYFQRVDSIKKNGIRTTNKFFQMKVDFIIRGLLSEWKVNYIESSNVDTILKNIS